MIRSVHRLAAVAVGFGLLAGCPTESPGPHPSRIVATVGARSIDAQDLITVLSRIARHGELPREEAFAGLRNRTLDTRIVEEVLLDEAEKRKVSAGPDLVEAEIATLLGQPPNSEVQAEAEAVHGGLDAWKAVVQRRLTLNLMERALRDELAQGTSVTPEQVQGALGRYSDRLARPARLRARQLFSKDPDAVRALHARLEAGEPFEGLAEELGLENGGDLGAMSLDAAPTLLVQTSATLQPGEYSGVLRSPLGYHVFQLVSRRPAGQPSPEESAKLVEGWLVEETVESRLRAWIAHRTSELGLEVREDVRDAVKCCRDGEPYLAPSREKS